MARGLRVPEVGGVPLLTIRLSEFCSKEGRLGWGINIELEHRTTLALSRLSDESQSVGG